MPDRFRVERGWKERGVATEETRLVGGVGTDDEEEDK